MPSHASSSVDLMLAVSCGLTLQNCLIIALSVRCRCWRLGFLIAKFHWHGALRSMATCPERKAVGRENWYQLLELFQAVFTSVVVENSQPPAADSMSPR